MFRLWIFLKVELIGFVEGWFLDIRERLEGKVILKFLNKMIFYY